MTEGTTYYTLWAVFRRGDVRPGDGPHEVELPDGVELRGVYDVSGMRADADLMVWFTGPTAEGLQRAYRAFRGLPGLDGVTWSAVGVHRDAEFTCRPCPRFMPP